MKKKKSKTQKSKKNQKKNLQTTRNKTSNTNKQTKKQTPKKTKNTHSNTTVKSELNKTKSTQSKKIVDKQQVKYNVALTESIKESKTETAKQLVAKDKVQYNIVLTNHEPTKELTKKETLAIEPTTKQETKKETKVITHIKKILNNTEKYFAKIKPNNNKADKKKLNKSVKTGNKKKPKKEEQVKPKNIVLRALYELSKNLHILFNVTLIVTYIILLTGLIRTNAFTKGAIIYISCIVIFLMLVAISYNKYLSGKVFTILIITGMSMGIYHMQYTYDFINNLNTNKYEYKTYYVVTFNNGQNKSIYNINNKKVCLLKDNSVNIERSLNTKLDNVKYIEHEDPNQLYSDFYNTNCRAIIVNKNQYKYLTNNIEDNSRNIKILYEFKANGKK